VRLVFPRSAESIGVHDVYGMPRHRIEGPHGSRPTVGMCMVQSIDGSTVVAGNSLTLSGPTDRDVLLGLRQIADVVLVGAATVRHEGYGPPSKAGQRVGVVSRSGFVDLTTPLFASGAGFLVVPDAARVADAPGVDILRCGTDQVDLPLALSRIPGTFLQLEGGSLLNAAMVEADLVDEINVTISPNIVAGAGPRLVQSSHDVLRRFQLAHVCEDDGFLFLRYVR
jgi:riboflavin biosynthesis pyrimidine reductase